MIFRRLLGLLGVHLAEPATLNLEAALAENLAAQTRSQSSARAMGLAAEDHTNRVEASRRAIEARIAAKHPSVSTAREAVEELMTRMGRPDVPLKRPDA